MSLMLSTLSWMYGSAWFIWNCCLPSLYLRALCVTNDACKTALEQQMITTSIWAHNGSISLRPHCATFNLMRKAKGVNDCYGTNLALHVTYGTHLWRTAQSAYIHLKISSLTRTYCLVSLHASLFSTRPTNQTILGSKFFILLIWTQNTNATGFLI